jgi:hypothetical protein
MAIKSSKNKSLAASSLAKKGGKNQQLIEQ